MHIPVNSLKQRPLSCLHQKICEQTKGDYWGQLPRSQDTLSKYQPNGGWARGQGQQKARASPPSLTGPAGGGQVQVMDASCRHGTYCSDFGFYRSFSLLIPHQPHWPLAISPTPQIFKIKNSTYCFLLT